MTNLDKTLNNDITTQDDIDTDDHIQSETNNINISTVSDDEESSEEVEPWHIWAQRVTAQAEQHLQRLDIETWIQTIKRLKH